MHKFFSHSRSFAAGFLIGAAYLPISVQFLLGSEFLGSISQLILFFVFPFCWSCLGFGINQKSFILRSWAETAAGVSIFVLLLVSLFFPVVPDAQYLMLSRLLLMGCLMGLFYFAAGVRLGSELDFRGAKGPLIYGKFILGSLVGYLLADSFIVYVGGNGFILFFSAFILINASRRLTFRTRVLSIAVIFLACSLADSEIENLRRVKTQKQGLQTSGFKLQKQSELLWSRRGQTFLVDAPDRNSWLVINNLKYSCSIAPRPEARIGRTWLYSHFRSDQDVILVGAGAGRSLRPEQISRRLTLVERDPGTVRLASRFNPNLGNVAYEVADGRAFIEHSAKKWDWIVIESSNDQANLATPGLFSPYSLYTPEALRTYKERLTSNGVLVVELNRVNNSRRKILLASVVNGLKQFEEEGFRRIIFKVVNETSHSTFFAILTRNAELIERIQAQNVGYVRPVRESREEKEKCISGFSDANPYINWSCSSDQGVGLALFSIFIVTATLILAGFRFFAKRGGDRPVQLVATNLFLQAVAQNMLFFGMVSRLRSVIGDDLDTYYIFIAVTMASSAAASFFAYQVKKTGVSLKPIYVFAALTVMLLLSEAAICSNVFHTVYPILNLLSLVTIPGLLFFAASLAFQISWGALNAMSDSSKSGLVLNTFAIVPSYALIGGLVLTLNLNAVSLLSQVFYLIWGVLGVIIGRRAVQKEVPSRSVSQVKWRSAL